MIAIERLYLSDSSPLYCSQQLIERSPKKKSIHRYRSNPFEYAIMVVNVVVVCYKSRLEAHHRKAPPKFDLLCFYFNFVQYLKFVNDLYACIYTFFLELQPVFVTNMCCRRVVFRIIKYIYITKKVTNDLGRILIAADLIKHNVARVVSHILTTLAHLLALCK